MSIPVSSPQRWPAPPEQDRESARAGPGSLPVPRPVTAGEFRGSSRYELLVKIASGGSASVYVGRVTGSAGFSRLVAVKRAHPHLAHDPAVKRMMRTEAQLASGLNHANVVAVQDVEQVGAELLLILDYVEGASLSELVSAGVSAGQPLPTRVAIRIALDACIGLAAVHEIEGKDGRPVGFLHRDVSPQNILVGVDGTARITDFGLAKHICSASTKASGMLQGKLAYLAPEIVDNGVFSVQTDLFAMGVVLWESVARRRLFQGDSWADTVRKVGLVQPSPLSRLVPGLDPRLDMVVGRALDKDPARRYPTVRAFVEALEAVAVERSLIATSSEVVSYVRAAVGESLRRRRALIRPFQPEDDAEELFTTQSITTIPRLVPVPEGVNASSAPPAPAPAQPTWAAAPQPLQPPRPRRTDPMPGAAWTPVKTPPLVEPVRLAPPQQHRSAPPPPPVRIAPPPPPPVRIAPPPPPPVRIAPPPPPPVRIAPPPPRPVLQHAPVGRSAARWPEPTVDDEASTLHRGEPSSLLGRSFPAPALRDHAAPSSSRMMVLPDSALRLSSPASSTLHSAPLAPMQERAPAPAPASAPQDTLRSRWAQPEPPAHMSGALLRRSPPPGGQSEPRWVREGLPPYTPEQAEVDEDDLKTTEMHRATSPTPMLALGPPSAWVPSTMPPPAPPATASRALRALAAGSMALALGIGIGAAGFYGAPAVLALSVRGAAAQPAVTQPQPAVATQPAATQPVAPQPAAAETAKAESARAEAAKGTKPGVAGEARGKAAPSDKPAPQVLTPDALPDAKASAQDKTRPLRPGEALTPDALPDAKPTRR